MFSISSKILLRILNPYKESSGGKYYPNQLKNRFNETNISTSESVQHWFIRLIKEILDGNIQACQIEDNMAVFAYIKWKNYRISYINFQVLIIKGGTLEQFSNRCPSLEYQYFRLDLDEDCISHTSLFEESIPHIHSNPNGPPRFFLDYRDSNNIILDFLEFIYLNYYPEKWRTWMKRVWQMNVSRKIEEDTLHIILQANKDNQLIPNIKNYKEDIIVLKDALKRERKKSLPLTLNNELLEIINF